MNPEILAQHMGQLHAYEQYLVFALAFGPFLVLGLVVFVVRRRDLAEETGEADEPDGTTGPSASVRTSTHRRATSHPPGSRP